MTLYTDIDPYCCTVLAHRVADGGLLPGDVCRADIRCIVGGRLRDRLRRYTQVHLFAGIGASPLGFRWAGWPDHLSLVTAGFPCQDISTAGRGAGLDGERSGLFWEALRVIRLIMPDWSLLENVGALSARGLDRVAGALEQVGYIVHALRVGAWAVGAPHVRERWWIVCRRRPLADADSRRCTPRPRVVGGQAAPREQLGRQHVAGDPRGDPLAIAEVGRWRLDMPRGSAHGRASARRSDPQGRAMADTGVRGLRTIGIAQAGPVAHRPDAQGDNKEPEPRYTNPRRWPFPYLDGPTPQYEWEPGRNHQCGVVGGPDGLPSRLARHLNWLGLRAIGNAQVPQVVEVIARAMLSAEAELQAVRA